MSEEFETLIQEVIDAAYDCSTSMEWGSGSCGPQKRLGEATDALRVRVAELEAKIPRWIPVSERLPEKVTTDLGEEYICMIGGSYNIVAPLNWDGENFFSGWISRTHWTSRVTHWMPMPEPPKDGEK